MAISTPMLVTFIVYIFGMVLIGFIAWRSTKNFDDYILGGRSLGPFETGLLGVQHGLIQPLLKVGEPTIGRDMRELSSIRNILQAQYLQYQQSKENIAIINRKYHDLKHQIA